MFRVGFGIPGYRSMQLLQLWIICLLAIVKGCAGWMPLSLGATNISPSSASASDAASPAELKSPEDLSAFDMLAGNVALCLIASDLKRDSGVDGSSTGWTSWVDDASAFRLQKCLDKMELRQMRDIILGNDQSVDRQQAGNTKRQASVLTEQDYDEQLTWLRWLKSIPAPSVIEYSELFRQRINATILPSDLEMVSQSHDEFLSRVACRIHALPSGASLQNNLRTFPGAMVYGILLFGGVTRYRVLRSTSRSLPRKAGERSVIASEGESTNSWLQYGGPERNYNGIDIGPCAFMELTIHPKGYQLPLLDASNHDGMVITKPTWNPDSIFHFHVKTNRTQESSQHDANASVAVDSESSATNEDDQDDAYIFQVEKSFANVVGGLEAQVESIVRRVLDGRAISLSGLHTDTATQMQEMTELLDMGLQPVRGLLLHGPPGCGKTMLAREISRLLTDRPPKIVAAPELLDRWVGGSERLVRDLFQDAEQELAMCGGDIAKCGLHVIVIDEIDAVFRRRSSSTDSGEVARASAVNQILAKLDGVRELQNILVIGTTNRRELLDKALLRPGRLEVQVEVPLPDKEGRREILKIHFDTLRRRGRLSRPLCEAIDGRSSLSSAAAAAASTTPAFVDDSRKRRKLSRTLFASRQIRDLADDRWTKGFSGADVAGLVRCAGSLALSRARQDGSGVDGLLITLEDVSQGLEETKR